jgi:hypothetical protein
MPLENRLLAADAFWRDDQAESGMQHMEAVVSIARRLNFRPKSVQALPIEKRAKHLAHMQDVSDAVATRALIAYHFAARKGLMAAFLDALGISHEDGLIKEESVPPPPRENWPRQLPPFAVRFPQPTWTCMSGPWPPLTGRPGPKPRRPWRRLSEL